MKSNPYTYNTGHFWLRQEPKERQCRVSVRACVRDIMQKNIENEFWRDQASKWAGKQASKQSGKQAGKQASSKQAGKQAGR